MIVESYLIKSKQLLIKDLDNIDPEVFVNIKDFKRLDPLLLDFNYLEGAISIKRYNKEVLGFRYWDLVDQLWEYFVDAIDRVCSDGTAQFSFPDQPLLVQIKKEYSLLKLHIGDVLHLFDLKLFLDTMLSAAIVFFTNLKELSPKGNKSNTNRIIQKAADLKNEFRYY